MITVRVHNDSGQAVVAKVLSESKDANHLPRTHSVQVIAPDTELEVPLATSQYLIVKEVG